MYVDSPGMIDSPACHGGGSYNGKITTSMVRGYDFHNVVKCMPNGLMSSS
jgi:hypothetical protein